MMEPRRYGSQQDEAPASDQPWWTKTTSLLLLNLGPTLLYGAIFTAVFLGWLSSPMLTAIQASNAQYENLQKLFTEVSKTQTAVAATQKATADAATARDSRMEALQLKLEALAKGNRMQCRSMAKLLKNQDMNEKCDEL